MKFVSGVTTEQKVHNRKKKLPGVKRKAQGLFFKKKSNTTRNTEKVYLVKKKLLNLVGSSVPL